MKSIPILKFYKHKYGRKLLVDVIDIDYMRKDLTKMPVYRETFYSLILITGGIEEISINEHKCNVHPGTIITSVPGEIWKWQPDTRLEGRVLLWEEEFLLSFFNDRQFLRRFAYLQPERTTPFLETDDELNERLLHIFDGMSDEIHNGSPDKDSHLLRAMLYETLMLINRAKNVGNPDVSRGEIAAKRYADTFVNLVNEHFADEHGIEFYAGKLFITSNYLNKIIKKSLGMTAKSFITEKIISEAKRLLTYTTQSVTEISYILNFESPSYFVHYFHKNEGITPNQYRESLKD